MIETRKHATRDALLAYIRADPEGRPLIKIYQFMRFHSGVKQGAAREALRRLCKAGVVERCEGRFYKVKGVETGWTHGAPADD